MRLAIHDAVALQDGGAGRSLVPSGSYGCPAGFKQAAKRAKWKVIGPKRAFLVQEEDRVGAVADLLDRLGTAKINVTAIDAICAGDGRYGVILWVAAKDVKKAATLLGVSAASAATVET